VGSTNQRFHYLTDRYSASIEGASVPDREVEWRVRDDGRLASKGGLGQQHI
jgi:anaerobic ribonucleoside-triphosphate reductase activating protein